VGGSFTFILIVWALMRGRTQGPCRLPAVPDRPPASTLQVPRNPVGPLQGACSPFAVLCQFPATSPLQLLMDPLQLPYYYYYYDCYYYYYKYKF